MRLLGLSTILAASSLVLNLASASPSPILAPQSQSLTVRQDASAPPNVSADTASSAASSLGLTLTKSNFYGAPTAPWKQGATPGWYYGDHQGKLGRWHFIPWLKEPFLCWILELFPSCMHCPGHHGKPPSKGWVQVFSNLTGAIQGDDYLTFGLVDTIDNCKTMCEGVTGCGFFNTYHDVNGKDGSPLLTCSLYSGCHTAADATNMGGQTQPDGSVDYITNSDGFCYKG